MIFTNNINNYKFKKLIEKYEDNDTELNYIDYFVSIFNIYTGETKDLNYVSFEKIKEIPIYDLYEINDKTDNNELLKLIKTFINFKTKENLSNYFKNIEFEIKEYYYILGSYLENTIYSETRNIIYKKGYNKGCYQCGFKLVDEYHKVKDTILLEECCINNVIPAIRMLSSMYKNGTKYINKNFEKSIVISSLGIKYNNYEMINRTYLFYKTYSFFNKNEYDMNYELGLLLHKYILNKYEDTKNITKLLNNSIIKISKTNLIKINDIIKYKNDDKIKDILSKAIKYNPDVINSANYKTYYDMYHNNTIKLSNKKEFNKLHNRNILNLSKKLNIPKDISNIIYSYF
jgi:hypothetical protein